MLSLPLPHIRVLSYNVHHCNPPGQPDTIDVEAIADVINGQSPDLVALQEVDVNTARCEHIDQAQMLATLTGMHLFFAKAIDFRGGDFGNVILSKFPIIESHQQALPSLLELQGEPRVLATIRVQTPEGFEFVFANTHLDSLPTEANRVLQIAAIRQALDGVAAPVILAGDFNATHRSATIAALDQSFQRTDRAGEFTFPADKPLKTIDFIAYKLESAFRVVLQRVVAETQASDHRPTFCIFEVL